MNTFNTRGFSVMAHVDSRSPPVKRSCGAFEIVPFLLSMGDVIIRVLCDGFTLTVVTRSYNR